MRMLSVHLGGLRLWGNGMYSRNETVRLNGTTLHLTRYVLNGPPAQVLSGTSITLNFGDEGSSKAVQDVTNINLP
jgi:hypothetical protein